MLVHKHILDIKKLPVHPKIAVIRLDNIGDHILGSGLFMALKKRLPNAHISLYTSACSQELYTHCPYIDRIIVDHKHYWGHFDIVINPRFAEDYYHAGALALSLGAPIRIAFNQFNEISNQYYTHLITANESDHVAEYTNTLLDALFGAVHAVSPTIWSSKKEEQQIVSTLIAGGWNEIDDLLVLAPGASMQYRTWPLNHVRDLMTALHEEYNFHIVIVGSKQEGQDWVSLTEQVSVRKFTLAAGLFSLPELAACLKLSKLFVGTDSGPKHMAAALGIPVIELGYFPDNWQSMARGVWTSGDCWGPYQVNNECLRPTSLAGPRTDTFRPYSAFTESDVYSGKSIGSITPGRVMMAVKRILEKTHANTEQICA